MTQAMVRLLVPFLFSSFLRQLKTLFWTCTVSYIFALNTSCPKLELLHQALSPLRVATYFKPINPYNVRPSNKALHVNGMAFHNLNVPPRKDPPIRILLPLHRIRKTPHAARHNLRYPPASTEDVQHYRKGRIQIRLPPICFLVLCRRGPDPLQ